MSRKKRELCAACFHKPVAVFVARIQKAASFTMQKSIPRGKKILLHKLPLGSSKKLANQQLESSNNVISYNGKYNSE
jgi:hypothetical protein